MSGLSLKCASKTKSIARSEFARSLAPRACPICRMGRAQRNPSMAARDGDGFRFALPILRRRFLLASVNARPDGALQTVAALRQSRPFRRAPVVLRFANRPRPPLRSPQFAFTGVAGVRAAHNSTAAAGLLFCRAIRLKGVQKNGVHRCWHELCID